MISSSSETSTSTANQCDSFTYIDNCTAHNNDLMDLQDHYIIELNIYIYIYIYMYRVIYKYRNIFNFI